jgi:murein DD-endopeptidase MepM/ murein hydrolase activator NlpD
MPRHRPVMRTGRGGKGPGQQSGRAMNRFLTRTIKIGKLTISIIPYEVVLLYVGERRIYVKTIRFTKGYPYKKIALAAAGVTVSIIITVFLAVSVGGSRRYNDDDLKQNLLNSANFTNERDDKKLVIREHRVRRGETLGRIARDYGVSKETIIGSNNLGSYDQVSEGTLLKIPNKDGILYKMRGGSSIVGIAQTYRIPLKKILDQNSIRNPDFIAVGTTLFIPDAKPQNIVSGFMWPTSSRFITCGYGWRRNPYNWNEREFHMGLDIRATYEMVKASKYGVISFAGWLGGYGQAIIVAHPNGWKTLYAHLSHVMVRNGQYVKQGQMLGKSGNTGRSTGAHLHFEVIDRSGRHENPYRYLRKARR